MIRLTGLLILVLLSTACNTTGAGQPDAGITPDAGPTPTRAASAFLTPQPGVEPVRFPEDEAPHDVLTEWWYYTGHMVTGDGDRYGFQLVFFQSKRGELPAFYAAHFAITDNPSNRFEYDQKSGTGANQQPEQGFHLRLDDWEVSGALGTDRLKASTDGYAIDVRLDATKPPALHNDIGHVDFGAAGSSYYYSRTRMELSGTLAVDGQPLDVTGQGWMDHQWGNFLSLLGGGWDWFAVQLDDGRELTISLVRNFEDDVVLSYGTVVNPDGLTEHLESDDLEVTATGEWTSQQTGTTYPAGWSIALPEHGWTLSLTPTLPDQELVTTATTGIIYWEGEVTVDGNGENGPVDGLGYVELTGYAGPSTAEP